MKQFTMWLTSHKNGDREIKTIFNSQGLTIDEVREFIAAGCFTWDDGCDLTLEAVQEVGEDEWWAQYERTLHREPYDYYLLVVKYEEAPGE